MFPGLARLQGGVPWAAGRVRPQRPAPRVTPPAHRLAAQRGSGCGPGGPRGGRRSVGLASQRRLSPTGVHSPALLHKLTSRCRPPPPPRPLCPCSGDAARWAPALFVLRGVWGRVSLLSLPSRGLPTRGRGRAPHALSTGLAAAAGVANGWGCLAPRCPKLPVSHQVAHTLFSSRPTSLAPARGWAAP